MRTFLQNSVDEEFYFDLNYTVAVKHDHLEFIFELDNAYSVIHILEIGKRELIALAYWGDYFKPLEGSAAYTMLTNMKSKCPTLYRLFNSPDEYFCPKMEDGFMGVAKKIEVDRIPALWMLDDMYIPKIVPTCCGPYVVSSEELVNELKENDRKLQGLDMEGYGLYMTSFLLTKDIKRKALWIKGVSDYANPQKNDDYHKTCAFSSATLLYMFIKEEM